MRSISKYTFAAIIGVLVAAVALGGFFLGKHESTTKAPASKISNAQYVAAYNDGFIDGSCQKWEDKGVDGFGNYCDTFGKENN
ncbi:hypothetical protein ACFC1L_39970 [Streptomyces sp. NPDC056210]|uniref:hypothetical protein n=1 Tax=Streptomyces sp. NPDC056210 TaxID=3345746 RepID=UPI0035D82E62